MMLPVYTVDASPPVFTPVLCSPLPRSNVSLTTHIISYIGFVVWAESLHYPPCSFHLGPVSITLCFKLPTVAAVRGRPFPLRSSLIVLSG